MNDESNEIIEKDNNNLQIDLTISKQKSEEFYKTSSRIINNLLEGYLKQDSKKDKEKDIIMSENDKKMGAFQKCYTKKEVSAKIRDILQSQRRASMKNFNKNESNVIEQDNTRFKSCFTISNLKNESIQKKKKYIEFDDLYFEDDMFIPESSSFPNEKEQDFLLKLEFLEENDYNEDIEDYSIRYCSINYKKNYKGQMHTKYFNNSNKDISEKKLPELDNTYNDEKEEIEKNICYIDNSKLNNNTKNTTKKNNINNIIINETNEQTIAYISINLLIKKVTLENFRNKYSLIYKCFLEQFKYFMNINNLINKIFSAFNHFHEKMKIDSSELILFLNTLIYENFDIIQKDKTIFQQLQEFFIRISGIKWENQELNQDLKTLEILLFFNKSFPNVENNEIEEEKINKVENKEIKKSKIVTEKNKAKSLLLSITKSFKEKEKKLRYFYILNFKKEEIAYYLTLDSYQLLSDIPESELYNKNFARKDKDILAPHIKKIFDRYEKLTNFIIEDICSYDKISERVDIIERWLAIANVCQELKNYNDLIMLNTLFFNYLLKKSLKKTWAKLSKKTLNYIDKINKFCSGDQCYKKIRSEIFKTKGPYIPYIGILLKQLTYIEEKKYIIDNKNINIVKLLEINRTIGKFFEFKKYKYTFDKSKNLEVLSNVNPKNEEELEEIIKKLEPELLIHAEKGDKKRLTQTDKSFYI